MKVSFGFTLSLLTRWQQLSVHQHILEMHLCMGSTCRCFWTDFIYTSLSSCRRTWSFIRQYIPSISSNHEVQFVTMMTNDWLYYHDIMVYTEHTCPQATQTHCSYGAQWWWWANSAYARTHTETQPYAHNAFHTVLAFRHTRAVSFFLFWHIVKTIQGNNELTWILPSLWSQAVDSCPTSSSLWSIWWVYFLFIRTGGQHRWDTKSLNPCMPVKGEMWWSILYLYVFFCGPFGAPIKESLMRLSKYGYITTACYSASLCWHLVDISYPLLEEWADVCGEEIQSCYPLRYHLVSP